MSKAQAGVGSILAHGDGATPTEGFTKVAEITKIGGPSFSAKSIDVTNMDSPSAAEEFIMSTVSAGEVNFEGNLLLGSADATQKAIFTDLMARTLRNFKYTLPTPLGGSAPGPWTFSGYYTKFEPDNSHEGKITFKAMIKISGVVTIP